MKTNNTVRLNIGIVLTVALLSCATNLFGQEKSAPPQIDMDDFLKDVEEPNIFLNKYWTKEAELKCPDGYTYYFMDFSILQGQEMLLVRIKNPKNAKDDYEELGSNNGDSPRSWASVIRPKGAPDDDYGQLYLSPKGMILGIRYDNKCYYAYDTVSSKFYTSKSQGFGDIETISPFLLIEAETQLHEPDVLAMLYEVIENSHYATEFNSVQRDLSPGCPSPDTLKNGTKHKNKRIREISLWCIKILNQGLSKPDDNIHKIIDYMVASLKSKNQKSRISAASALGYFKTSYVYKAIPHLEEIIINNDESSIASKSAYSLGKIGTKAFPVLSKLLKSEESSVRFYGLYGFRIAGIKARNYAKTLFHY